MDLAWVPPVSAAEVWARVRRGGYPEAVARDGVRRQAWWDAYLQEVVRFEIAELRAIEGLLEVSTLLRRLLDTRIGSPRLHHFRTSNQREVDAVPESRDGRPVGIEVKAARTVRSHDFDGLRTLADTVGERFVAGLLLHPAEQVVPFGDHLFAVPLSLLWTAV